MTSETKAAIERGTPCGRVVGCPNRPMGYLPFPMDSPTIHLCQSHFDLAVADLYYAVRYDQSENAAATLHDTRVMKKHRALTGSKDVRPQFDDSIRNVEAA